MKIAVPTFSNRIDDHFGHCDHYTIYTIDDNKSVVNKEILQTPNGCGCKSNIGMILKQKNVTVMLAGHMGEGAFQMLRQSDIHVIRGCRGETDKVVKSFLENELTDSGIHCLEHEHHHHHGEGRKH